ncbi:gamma-glutamylcyclotransferase [Cupriavidus basilensis]
MGRIARKVEDAGPAPGVVVHNEADYDASLDALLAAVAWHGQDIWLFAYGSLLWNPGFEVDEADASRPARLASCPSAFGSHGFAGTPEQPGLMMSLVPGGSCRGALYRIAGDRAHEGPPHPLAAGDDRQAAHQSTPMGDRQGRDRPPCAPSSLPPIHEGPQFSSAA